MEPNAVPGLRVWDVAGLLLAVSDALAARFAAVAVRGELSGFSRAGSGHCYFTLKDGSGANAGLRCAMFRRAALMLPFNPQDGQQVELRGRLAVYEARGELQMIVESMQRVGVGSLYEEFLRLKARLEAQGVFDMAYKRPLPAFPRRLAVVTSPSGAAIHDVLTTLARRAPQVGVVLVPTLVQGVQAPEAIVQALAQANGLADVELILLCRGGGSLEDLWAFNDERVVRAVRASHLPVVCGVGHETDVTLADLAADLRAPTPTAAAELAAPEREALLQALQARAQTLSRRVRQRLDGASQGLDTLALRLQRPAQRLGTEQARLAALAQRHGATLSRSLEAQRVALAHRSQRLVQAARSAQARQADRLRAEAARLAALDPRRVLSRGYAWVEAEDGRAIVSAHSLQAGQTLRAVWSDGTARATVDEVNLGAPAADHP
ncbi:exodeoxyribonuclease VII large subunit [Ideonella sp.]|uniref:exodeoxyribonuclease VII large subunit n=1 Tax=Ideonella sp. TaxID=1929293 RepID=UPI002B4A155C|nr:exodeoxyribonuclease VII large subunit [Ideonella sp.]HJV70208.1 exodeoxyribonuclease VII large subunit [Ideonella sp.]